MEKIDYLILIRGINVGGKNVIKMDDLKRIFVNMHFTDIQIYIQTGNIFFKDHRKDKKKLIEIIEKTLSENMKNEIKIAILTLSELENAVKNVPDGFGEENEKYKYDIMFLLKPLTTKIIMEEIKTIKNEDKIFEGENVFYVIRSSKKLTGSYIAQIVNKWKNVTVRNFKVTKELYNIMKERKKSMKDK